MARINIEAYLLSSKRLSDLTMAMRSRPNALGAVIEAYLLASRFVSPENPEAGIPLQTWLDEGLAVELVGSNFAVVRDEMVFVAFAKEQFAWIVQKHEAGRKGGRPAKETGNNREKAEQTENNPLSPSLPLTPSHTQKKKNSSSSKIKRDKTAETPIQPESSEALLASVSSDHTKAWSMLYPDPDFITKEALRAFTSFKTKAETLEDWQHILNRWFDNEWKKREASASTIDHLKGSFLRVVEGGAK